MFRPAAATLVGLVVLLAGSARAEQLSPVRFDNWLSYQRNENGSAKWLYDPRIYVPFDLSGGWTFTQRVDLPASYTDSAGSANPGGGWKAGVGDAFIEEILSTSELAPNFRLGGSMRFVFPTGNGSPFGSGQYQIAPMLNLTYAMPERGVVLAPVARYFISYHATQPNAAKIRQLDLYPIVTIALPDSWGVAFYPENGIGYNAETHKWFVPIDAMLIRHVNKSVELGLGVALPLVKDDPQYKYIVYGRATLYF
jgi:hypothetical protein